MQTLSLPTPFRVNSRATRSLKATDPPSPGTPLSPPLPPPSPTPDPSTPNPPAPNPPSPRLPYPRPSKPGSPLPRTSKILRFSFSHLPTPERRNAGTPERWGAGGAGVQECRNAGMQDSRNAGMQECRIAGMQECRNAGTQERRNAGAQERRNVGTPGRRNAGTQEHNRPLWQCPTASPKLKCFLLALPGACKDEFLLTHSGILLLSPLATNKAGGAPLPSRQRKYVVQEGSRHTGNP